jgi:hypothetical protein
MDRIHTKGVTDNVVQLMAAKAGRFRGPPGVP